MPLVLQIQTDRYIQIDTNIDMDIHDIDVGREMDIDGDLKKSNGLLY